MAEIKRSVCALDCPDACSMLVEISDGRATRLRGNPAHPVTQGFLCAKVTRYLEREYSPDRLLYPMRRVGAKGEGRFERISWDQALEEITAQIKSVEPQSVLPYSYAGTMGVLNRDGMDRRFFHRLGASRLDRTICASTGGAALDASYGLRCGMEPERFADAKLIIAWGANVLGTNVHLWPFIVEARRRGAKLYTIDPVTTRVAALADRHFGIFPGSDHALALAVAHVIFREKLEDAAYLSEHANGADELRSVAAQYPPERAASLTGVDASDIVTLAREYATTRPAAIRLNYGVQRSERGGAAVRAVAALPVITGAWKHPGGGMQLTTSGGFQFNRAALERSDLQPAPTRIVNMIELGKALTELDSPPVKVMIVYNSNPAAVAPNQNLVLRGLARPDLFTVVLDHFQTDTADWADIVLPATTFLEHTDLYSAYGHYHLQLARPALPAPGECKSNVEVFRQLAARMGFDDPCFRDTEDDMIRTLLSSGHPYLEGITLERLEREGSVRLNLPEPFLPFANGFKTPSGKCALGAAAYTPPIESRHGTDATRYPLELVASKNSDSLNSTFGFRPETDRQTAYLHMHSADAAPRGIESGDTVLVHNDRGSLLLTAQVDGQVRAGVVHAPSVRWPKRALDKRNTNALTSDRLTDIGGGPVFFSCLVEVAKQGQAAAR